MRQRVASFTNNATRAVISRWCRLLLAAVSLLSVLPLCAAEVDDIRLWRSPDKTRLVFDVSAAVEHNTFMLDNPARLVIDLKDTHKNTRTIPKLDHTVIQNIRFGVRNRKNLRIVLDLKSKVTPDSFLLKPNATYGHRLVLDLFDQQAKTTRQKPVNSGPVGQRDIVIAIDPGHGGEDPGAVGYGGAHEKVVTLKIAKDLAALLEREPGFKAILTRTGDYYIPLRERSQMAREAGADLFISVHADAFTDIRARGASVFTLSRGGASSETARWLAQKENMSDQIGGEGGISLGDKDDVLASVLLDLSMTSTMSSSMDIGDKVLKNIGSITRLHKKKVEQAAFVVLKSPDIPSILVETGFISNPAEAKKLKSPSHQKALARQIFKGVKSYFVHNPPLDTLVSSFKGEGKTTGRPEKYVIKAGDTLSEIASQLDVPLRQLMGANNIARADKIRVGQVLVIPN